MIIIIQIKINLTRLNSSSMCALAIKVFLTVLMDIFRFSTNNPFGRNSLSKCFVFSVEIKALGPNSLTRDGRIRLLFQPFSLKH